MFLLKRRVRFAINDDQDATAALPRGSNGFADAPAVEGLGRHYELEFTCRGELDPDTCYLVDIKDADRAVRTAAVPIITRAIRHAPAASPLPMLPEILAALRQSLDARAWSVRLHLTPTYSLEAVMTDPSTVLLRQRFDFAAAHRLHNPALSDADNRARYGKCNNLRGHGHNYQFEPCVAINPAASTFSLATLESLAAGVLLDRFDHKHLNEDTIEFSQAQGVIPSVENIARVFFTLLAPAIRDAGAELRSMTVWETDRTSATYPA